MENLITVDYVSINEPAEHSLVGENLCKKHKITLINSSSDFWNICIVLPPYKSNQIR